jgi:hypothetical protein
VTLLEPEKWPAWLREAYPDTPPFGIAAVAEPPDEAGEADGVLYLVRRQGFNSILCRVDPGSVLEQWCFHTLPEALAALVMWDGLPPGPRGWIRNLSRRGCWRQDLDTGEVWKDGHRKLWAVRVEGQIAWWSPPPVSRTRAAADAKAHELGGEVVELEEHEVEGWW